MKKVILGIFLPFCSQIKKLKCQLVKYYLLANSEIIFERSYCQYLPLRLNQFAF